MADVGMDAQRTLPPIVIKPMRSRWKDVNPSDFKTSRIGYSKILAGTAMKYLLTIIASSLLLTAQVSARVISFDNLDANRYEVKIANGYQGFDWTNFYAISQTYAKTYLPGTSYEKGIISAPNAAFNGWGDAASFSVRSGTFTFNSALLTAAWGAGLRAHFDGYLNNDIIYSANVDLNQKGTTLGTFNWSGVDKITMTATTVAGGGLAHVVIDDLNVVAAIPEPKEWAMMLVGAGLVGLQVRRKQNRQWFILG